jgi:hypothetical protein
MPQDKLKNVSWSIIICSEAKAMFVRNLRHFIFRGQACLIWLLCLSVDLRVNGLNLGEANMKNEKKIIYGTINFASFA